jgi:carbonic anhydrase
MKRLIEGIAYFHDEVYEKNHPLFDPLVIEQHPRICFITCADSRLDPTLLTHTQPGEMFVIRNAGNLIPPYSPYMLSGEGASIDYAVKVLHVQHLVVCGHTGCGAIEAVLEDEALVPEDHHSPCIDSWLRLAAPIKKRLKSLSLGHPHSITDTCWQKGVEENVKLQLEHLSTYPTVQEAIAKGTLKVHGWCYHLESGVVDIIMDGEVVPSEESIKPEVA